MAEAMNGPVVEHYVGGRRAYTLGEASDLLHVEASTLRQRARRSGLKAAGWINPREPVYFAEDLGIPSRTSPIRHHH